MPASWTSRLAYQQDIERLNGLRRDVYRCIRDWPLPASRPSIEDIAERMDMRVATVCGRLGELKEAGLIQEGNPKRSKSTGKKVKTYILAPYREKPPALKQAVQQDLFGESLDTNQRHGAFNH